MIVTFSESGMNFAFEDSALYRLEKSKKIKGMQSFKPCECVVSFTQGFDFIEAKTNAPNPNNRMNQCGIDDFWNGIEQKFVDSMLFVTSILSSRNVDEECPYNFTLSSLKSLNYRFILIIKDLETRFLPDQMLCFKKRMRHLAKAWNIQDNAIIVLNEEIARKKRYIK